MTDLAAVDDAWETSLSRDLAAITNAFDLGELTEPPQYLADGLMNRNWRIGTTRGRFAVKQIIDVPLEAARPQSGDAVGAGRGRDPGLHTAGQR